MVRCWITCFGLREVKPAGFCEAERLIDKFVIAGVSGNADALRECRIYLITRLPDVSSSFCVLCNSSRDLNAWTN